MSGATARVLTFPVSDGRCLLLSCFRTAQELEFPLASVDLRHGLDRVADQSNGLVNAYVKFHI